MCRKSSRCRYERESATTCRGSPRRPPLRADDVTALTPPDPLPHFYDCGCPDLYFCPTSQEVECPRHSGFDICCDNIACPIPVRAHISSASSSRSSYRRRG